MYGKMEGNVKPYSTDVCVPIDSLDEMISRAQEILRKWAMTSSIMTSFMASLWTIQKMKFKDLGTLKLVYFKMFYVKRISADLQNEDGNRYIWITCSFFNMRSSEK